MKFSLRQLFASVTLIAIGMGFRTIGYLDSLNVAISTALWLLSGAMVVAGVFALREHRPSASAVKGFCLGLYLQVFLLLLKSKVDLPVPLDFPSYR